MDCPQCGSKIRDPGALFCPRCGGSLTTEDQAPGGSGTPTPEEPVAPPPGRPAAPPPEAGGVPFEDPSIPFFTRFGTTILAAFREPVRLFSGLTEGAIGAPLLYGHIITTVGIVAYCLWNLSFSDKLQSIDYYSAEFLDVWLAFLKALLFLSPLFALVGLFLSAGIFHLMLLLVGDGQRGFPVTFRAICYGATPLLLFIVPVCGGIIGPIWAMVLIILGAVHGQRTGGWRAVLAFFLPMFFCCCLNLVLVLVVKFLEGPIHGF